MCGIAGWINLKDDISSKLEIIEAMSETMAKRGPDASGLWTSPHALIAHRRLIVVDPKGGGQPMIRERGGYKYVITYNGELYNTSELRRELQARGHVCTSTSDTEVLLLSYIEWGPECVDHLNGIYAFGIWSEKEQSFFLARDRFGVKPLFYTLKNDSLIFGSELKALLAHPFVKPTVDTEGLAEVFSLGPARTPGNGVFKGVCELEPAGSILYDHYGLHKKQYWSLLSSPHEDSLDRTTEKLGELVKDAITRQLSADVPVCTFLSGGLDSSAITALAARYFRDNMNMQLHTFSVDYIDNALHFKPSVFQPNPDAPWVKRMSEEFGTCHHYIELDTPQLAEALIGAMEARDLPGMADVDSSLWLFCREIKKNSTVALSGECADEVFGGYPWFYREEMLNENTFPWSRNLKDRVKTLSRELRERIKPGEYMAVRYQETLDRVPKLAGEDPLEARQREMCFLNFTWFMQTLLDRKDRMSMAHGLEVRVPFCDHKLVEYVWNIPWKMKLLDGREKGLLRKALTGVLPDDVLYRKKSPYPKTHNPSYEKAVIQRAMEILDEGTSPIMPLIDAAAVRQLAAGSSDYGKPWFGQLMAGPQLFAHLIQLDAWFKKYKVNIE